MAIKSSKHLLLVVAASGAVIAAIAFVFIHGHGGAVGTESVPAPVNNVVKPSTAPATTSDWPAFHGGGPLLGVAEAIGAPPMRQRWVFRASDIAPAPTTSPTTKPIEDEGGGPPGFEASAAIVKGVVYIGNRAGALIAVDLNTGQSKWTYKADAGFSAGPAVMNDTVYIGDEDGVFHAVSTETGKKLWTYDSGAGIHSSANFVGDKVVFGNDGADILCLNASDGKKIWDDKAGDRVNGAPAIGGAASGMPPNVLVSGCDAQLRAINLGDGKEQFAKDLGALCPGSPAIAPGKIVVGTDGGKVLCFSDDGQKQLWTFEGIAESAMVYSSPAVSDGIVVFGARDRNVYGLDLETGKKKWVFPTRGDVDSSPVISGGRVYIASKDKRLYVLDLHAGQKLWEFVAGRGITATPAIGEGVVVIGDTAGNLYCLEPGGD